MLQAHRVIYEVTQMIYDAESRIRELYPRTIFSAAYAAVETEISGLLEQSCDRQVNGLAFAA